MYFEEFVTKKYDTYSIYEKIDLLLTLHNIFNLMFESMEKIRKTKELDLFEEEIINLELLNLKNDIWKCENEINKIHKQTTDKYIKEKVEAAQINQTSREITTQVQTNDSLVKSLKKFLLQISLYCLQIKDLNNRKAAPSISEKEKSILPKIIEALKLKIKDNYHEIEYNERWDIPTGFRHRREIIDSIEDSQIEASEVLPSESCITVDYLKDEKDGNIDLRKWKTKKWLTRRYDMFRSSKYPFLDHGYVFNFQALMNGFYRYSFRKQIEVSLSFYNSYKIQLEALTKWRKTRPEKLTEYEELIYSYKATEYQIFLDTLYSKVLNVFYVDIVKPHFYSPEAIENIYEKICAVNLKVDSYYMNEIGEQSTIERKKRTKEKYNELLANYESLEAEYNRKFKSLSLSFAPGRMCGDVYISPSDPYDPERAEYIRFLLTVHNIQTVECDALLKSIKTLKEYEKRYEKIVIESLCVYSTHNVLLTDEKIWDAYNMLPNDYPDIKKILKEIKKAKVCPDLEGVKKEKKSDRDLYNYSAYPSSRELFVHDEPPKPIEYFEKKSLEPEDKSPGES